MLTKLWLLNDVDRIWGWFQVSLQLNISSSAQTTEPVTTEPEEPTEAPTSPEGAASRNADQVWLLNDVDRNWRFFQVSSG